MLEYLAALVLLGHGLGHTIGFAASWSNIETGLPDRPWLLGGDVRMKSPAGKAFGLLFLVAAALFVISAALAAMGSTDWRAFALSGSAVSAIAILPWWNSVIAGVKLGFLLDAAIVLVLLVPGGESFVEFFNLP